MIEHVQVKGNASYLPSIEGGPKMNIHTDTPLNLGPTKQNRSGKGVTGLKGSRALCHKRRYVCTVHNPF